jgi:hypothetical protein
MVLDNSGDILTWQRQLLPYIQKVDLICEIPFDRDDLELLSDDIAFFIKKYGLARGTQFLVEECDVALALFLVAEGIYGYVGGDYWTGLCNRIEMTQQYKTRWGEAFERFLHDHKMPLFEEDVKGQRFLKIILAHGGIPDYCLGDFFEKLLQPVVERSEMAGLTAIELIQSWRSLSSAFHFIDRPVRRFMLYGGRVAEDFLDRSLEMALRACEDGVVPPAEELGLPERVVVQYKTWLENRGNAIGPSSNRKVRLRRPVLACDPWGSGIHLRLPEQSLDIDPAQGGIVWEIRSGDRSQIFLATHWHKEGCVVTEEEVVTLDQNRDSYDVCLKDGVHEEQLWTIPGMNQALRLLAFDPDTQMAVNLSGNISQNDLWVFYFEEYELLDSDGRELSVIEKLPRQPGQWHRYCGLHIELKDVSGLIVKDYQGVSTPVVLTRKHDTKAVLVGSPALPSALFSPENDPVYFGMPPVLRLPLDQGNPVQELERWAITIRPGNSSMPSDIRHVPVNQIEGVSVSEFFADIPLAHASLLGENPVGTFHLLARGPLGKDSRLTLHMVPELTVDYANDLWLSDAPGRLSLGVHEGVEVSKLAREGSRERCPILRSDQDMCWYDVEVDETDIWARIEIETKRDAYSARVPLHVRVPRIRWAMIGLEDDTRLEWHCQIMKMPYDALAQASDPELLLDVGLADSVKEVSLCLLDDDGRVIQSEVTPLGILGRCRFLLAKFRDNLALLRQPVAEFHLYVYPHNLEKTISVPVLHVQQNWEVENIEFFESLTNNQEKVFEIFWSEDRRIRDRVARFWSLWRPWTPPLIFLIEDDASGRMAIQEETSQLIPGKYRLELAVQDIWGEDKEPVFPRYQDNNTVDVLLGSQAERDVHLDLLPENAVGCLERFLGSAGDDVHNWHELQTLLDVATPEDVPELLEVLLSLIMGHYGETRAIDRFRDDFIRDVLVKKHPDAFLSALALREARTTPEEKNALIILIIRSGLLLELSSSNMSDSDAMESLYRLWTPLGVILDVNSLPSREILRRFERHLGQKGIAVLQPWRSGTTVKIQDASHNTIWDATITDLDKEEAGQDDVYLGLQLPDRSTLTLKNNDYSGVRVFWKTGTPVGAVWIEDEENSEIESFQKLIHAHSASPYRLSMHPTFPEGTLGMYCPDQMLDTSVEMLQQQLEKVKFDSPGIVDYQTFIKASYDWLIKIKRDPDAEGVLSDLVGEHTRAIKNDLDRLFKAGLLSKEIQTSLLGCGSDEALNPLKNLPFFVGAVALVIRLISRHEEGLEDLYISERMWLDWAQKAYEYAPSLFVFYLCLSELLLAWYNVAIPVLEGEDLENG